MRKWQIFYLSVNRNPSINRRIERYLYQLARSKIVRRALKNIHSRKDFGNTRLIQDFSITWLVVFPR